MKLRRFFAVIAVSLLAVFGTVTPANAALYGCPSDYVCLYQWKSFGADRWQSSFYNLLIDSDNCINLTSPMAYWDNDTPVTDNSGSLIINGSGGWNQWYNITLYNWVNCNSGGGSTIGYNLNWLNTEADLADVQISATLTAYHTLTSLKLTHSCPPSGC